MERRFTGEATSEKKTEARARRLRGCGRAALVASTLLAGLLSASQASAQDKTFYLDRLKMAGAPDDAIGVWRPQMSEATRFYGQVGFGFSLNPLRIASYVDTVDQSAILEEESGPPVSAQLITYVTAGAEIADRVSFQASFPLALYEAGNTTISERAQIEENITLSTVAPMDLRLDGRLIVLRNEARSLKLAISGSIWLPTGNKFSYGGDNGVAGAAGVAGEYDAKWLSVTLNAGFHVRPLATMNTLRIGNELTYGLAALLPLNDGAIRVGAQIFGSMGVGNGTTGDIDNTPLEAMLEGRLRLGNNPGQGWLGLGAGGRLTGGYAPDFRVVAVVGGWFPLEDSDVKNNKGFLYKIPGDADNDKIPDDIDMCPTDAEDKKGNNADDGCPELLNDADSDGVPDSQDTCPKEPGVRSAETTKNGCPEFIRRMKGSATIEVLQEVQFEFDRANLRPVAFPILNEVVRLLRVNPDIELVSIEGHTDDMGTEEHNDQLSEARAKSVLDYLVQRGIAASRLESKGFGERKPIADNKTDEGRAKNRRVEFHILRVKGAPAAQPAPAGGATPPAGPAPAPSPGTAPAPGPAPAPAGSDKPPQPPPAVAPPAAAAPAPAAPAGSGKPAPAAPAAPAGSGKGAPAAPPAAPKASGDSAKRIIN